MNWRLFSALALMVLAPVGLLSWYATRVAQGERQALRQSASLLLQAQLSGLEGTLRELLNARERHLAGKLDPKRATPDSLRALVDEDPLLSQLLLVGPDGRRIHPPPRGPTSEQERAFLLRTASLQAELSTLGAHEGKSKTDPGSGWYSWFWGDGLNLAFWERLPSGHLFVYELDRARLLADVIAALPEDQDVATGDRQLVLLDARGSPLYQWGAHRRRAGEAPAASRALAAPLHAWKLQSYVLPTSGVAQLGRGIWVNVLSGVGALGLALLGLGFYLYRETTRAGRTAQQRVSFVNQVSHELKTPLTNIRMYTELLQQRLEGDDDKTDRYLHVVVGECERLSRLIDNVLCFARQQRGGLRLRRGPVVLDEIISQVVEAFRPALSAKGIAITLRAGASTTAQLDADVVRQIVTNLLSNVEKYAGGGASVTVETRQRSDRVEVLVADTGAGIPPGDRERVFNPFMRLRSRVDEGASGTGIGLTISRGLARLHGGDLRLVGAGDRDGDTDKGPGAIFKLELACGQARADGAAK